MGPASAGGAEPGEQAILDEPDEPESAVATAIAGEPVDPAGSVVTAELASTAELEAGVANGKRAAGGAGEGGGCKRLRAGQAVLQGLAGAKPPEVKTAAQAEDESGSLDSVDAKAAAAAEDAAVAAEAVKAAEKAQAKSAKSKAADEQVLAKEAEMHVATLEAAVEEADDEAKARAAQELEWLWEAQSAQHDHDYDEDQFKVQFSKASVGEYVGILLSVIQNLKAQVEAGLKVTKEQEEGHKLIMTEHTDKIGMYEEQIRAVLEASQRFDEGFRLCTGNVQLFQRALGYTVSVGCGARPAPIAAGPAAGGSGVLVQPLGLPPGGAGGFAGTVHAAPIELAVYKGGLDVISVETKCHLKDSRFFTYFELREAKEDGKRAPVILQALFWATFKCIRPAVNSIECMIAAYAGEDDSPDFIAGDDVTIFQRKGEVAYFMVDHAMGGRLGHNEGFMKEERDIGVVDSDVTFRGTVAVFVILPDGTLLVGIDTEYVRRLDIDLKRSATNIHERVFVRADQCFFVDWKQKAPALLDVTAIQMLNAACWGPPFNADFLYLKSTFWFERLTVFGFRVLCHLNDGNIDCWMPETDLGNGGQFGEGWERNCDLVQLNLDTESNLRFANYQTENCFYSDELKDIHEVEIANALNGALSELKAQPPGELSPTAADAAVLFSSCEKVFDKLGRGSRATLAKHKNDVLILTKSDKVTGPGWRADVAKPQTTLILNRQCGLLSGSVGVALTALSRVHDGSLELEGGPCECVGCCGTPGANAVSATKLGDSSRKLVLVRPNAGT